MFKKSSVHKINQPTATVSGYIIHVWHTLFRVISVPQLPTVSMERSWHIQQTVQYIWVSWINLDSTKAPLLLPHKVHMQYTSTCSCLFNKKTVLLEYMRRSTCLMHSARGRYFLCQRKSTKKEISLFLEITSILPSCLKLSIHLSALLNSGLNMHVVKLQEVWNTKTLLIKLCGAITLFYTEASKLFPWNFRHCICL